MIQLMKPRADGHQDGFVMLFCDELISCAMEAIAAKRLASRDSTVLLAMLGHMNWKTGRVDATLTAMGRKCGVSVSQMADSAKRLRLENLIARVYEEDTGRSYYLINPRMACVGGPQKRAYLFQQFDEAIEQERRGR